jgi:hypothetical protein
MNREVQAKCMASRAEPRGCPIRTRLLLACVVAYPCESAVRAAEYASDAVTQVRVLVGPAPAFHLLHGWVEPPQPSVPRGFVMLPVACNSGARSPRIWLCYKRGPVGERPLADVRVAGDGSAESPEFQEVPVPLIHGVKGLPVRLYSKCASGAGEPVLIDLLLRTTLESVRGYECDGRNLNEGGKGSPVYLYRKDKDAASVHGPPFAQGIRPEMLNAPDTEYEIARAQVNNDRLLVRLQKLEVRRATVAAGMPFRRTEAIKHGMNKQEMNQFARSLNVGLTDGYAGLKACVGATLGWTSSSAYTTSEEETRTEEANLAAEDHDRYYAFATVLDVLRIRDIATGRVVTEAVSRTDNNGYFVTDRYGGWEGVPRHSGVSR